MRPALPWYCSTPPPVLMRSPLPLKAPEMVEATRFSRMTAVPALVTVIRSAVVALRRTTKGFGSVASAGVAVVNVTAPSCRVPFGVVRYGANAAVRDRSMSVKLAAVGSAVTVVLNAPGSRR